MTSQVQPPVSIRFLLSALLALAVSVFGAGPVATANEHVPSYLQIVKTAPGPEDGLDSGFDDSQLVGAHFVAKRLGGLGKLSPQELGDLVVSDPRLLTSDPGVPVLDTFESYSDQYGVALFTGLKEGIYQVTELSRRQGDVSELLSSPFLVIVSGTTTAVRNKTQPQTVSKTANVQQLGFNKEVIYSIDASIPQPDKNGKLSKAEFRDTIDSRLTFGSVTDINVTNLDKTVKLADGDYKLQRHDNDVLLALTESGLKKVAEARAGHPEAALHFKLHATLTSLVLGGTKIENIISYSPDGHCSHSLEEGGCAGFFPAVTSEPATVTTPAFGPIEGIITGLVGLFVLLFGGAGVAHLIQSLQDNPSVQPDTPSDAGVKDVLGHLASTGASVIGLSIFGLVLLLIGIFLMISRRRKEESDSTSDGVAVNSGNSERREEKE